MYSKFLYFIRRLLLPYERHQRGEETKVRPTHGRRMKSAIISEDLMDVKPEIGRICKSEAPSSPEAPTGASSIPQTPSILSSSVNIFRPILSHPTIDDDTKT